MSLDTTIEGSAGRISAVADWLRGDFHQGAESLASSVYRQRSRSGSAWQGEAGGAFRGRATTLASASDEAVGESSAVAGLVDTLAAKLARAQDGMAEARDDARAGGLTVHGNVIEPPGNPPPDVPALAAGATPEQALRYEEGMAAIDAYNALVGVWEQVNRAVQSHFDDWHQALESAAQTWQQHDANLTGLTANFLTAGATAAITLKVAPVLAGEAAEQSRLARSLRSHAGANLRNGRLVSGTSPGHYYDLLNRADAADAKAARTGQSAQSFKVPKGVGRGLGAVGVLATGYAIHSDIEDGESPAQAAVSNGAGMVAAIGASAASGAYIGGVAGSFIPVPGVGTAIGVVGGVVVGSAVGLFTSGAIDSLWESGADSLGDVGNAVVDGLDEVGDTASAVGDLAEDAFDAIF